jgi:5-methylcytosine-specific restriction enzyme subunit McrC
MTNQILGAPIVLTEHTEQVIDLDTRTARELAAFSLADVSVVPCVDGWKVRPSHMVGTFEVNSQKFVIRPKIEMANVLALLDVDLKTLHWGNDQFDYESTEGLLVSIVRLFSRALELAMSRGLRHDYVAREERISAIRGRIDFSAVARRPGALIPIPCKFDEYTPDIRINQLLHSAVVAGLRIPGVPRKDIERLRHNFANFESVGMLSGSLDWIDDWTPTRLEQHYESAVRLAGLILKSDSVNQNSGRNSARTFLVNMNQLVEKFIETRIKNSLPNGVTQDAQRSRKLDRDGRVNYRPDVTLIMGKTPVAVVDIKYKNVATFSEANSADLYQVHTYAQVLSLLEASLITCVADLDSSNQSDSIVFNQTGVAVNIYTVNFMNDLKEIELQIRSIVKKILSKAEALV